MVRVKDELDARCFNSRLEIKGGLWKLTLKNSFDN